MRFALALMTSIALAACSGGSGTSSDTSPVSSEILLKDVFPTSGDALAWSLKATNATELKTYFEKSVPAADKIQIIPPSLPTVGVPVASAPGATSTSTSTAATPSQTTLSLKG